MRLVIKIGTNSISNAKANAINFVMIETLTRTISRLFDEGNEVILVTSGAVGYGVVKLAERSGKYADPKYVPALAEKPFLASVGQPLLMKHYIDSFEHYKKQTAQILISSVDDFEHKLATKTILATLKSGVIPIINENDSVYDAELKIGDNDTLSARVAEYTRANHLFLITDVNGLHTKENGKLGKLVKRIPADEIDRYMKFAGGSHSAVATGGMLTKLTAAKIANGVGCVTHIINNTEVININKITNGAEIGTTIGGLK